MASCRRYPSVPAQNGLSISPSVHHNLRPAQAKFARRIDSGEDIQKVFQLATPAVSPTAYFSPLPQFRDGLKT